MAISEYLYELRRGDEIVATGRLSREDPLEVGDRVLIGGHEGIVRAAAAVLSRPLSATAPCPTTPVVSRELAFLVAGRAGRRTVQPPST